MRSACGEDMFCRRFSINRFTYSYFSDFFQPNYPKIYRTDLREICSVDRTLAVDLELYFDPSREVAMAPILAQFSGLVAQLASMIAVKLGCDRSMDVATATNFCLFSPHIFFVIVTIV